MKVGVFLHGTPLYPKIHHDYKRMPHPFMSILGLNNKCYRYIMLSNPSVMA